MPTNVVISPGPDATKKGHAQTGQVRDGFGDFAWRYKPNN